MKRKLLLLNLALIALASAAGWQLRTRWLADRAQERKMLQAPARPVAAPPPAPLQSPSPAAAANYSDVAQRTLFARDRSPNVIEEVAPPKPVPPFPVAFGKMNLGGSPKVILSERAGGPSRSYETGATVGEFTLESIEGDEIVLSWDGQEFRKTLQELRPKAGAMVAVTTAPAEVAAPAPAQVQTASTSPAAEGPDPNETGDMRTCQAGDTSPAGTIRDGFRKIMTRGPFGFSCHWERVR